MTSGDEAATANIEADADATPPPAAGETSPIPQGNPVEHERSRGQSQCRARERTIRRTIKRFARLLETKGGALSVRLNTDADGGFRLRIRTLSD
jgi:hypothetical protein